MSLEWILLGLRLVAVLILYTFLGVALTLIWHDLKQAAHQSVKQYRLRVTQTSEPTFMVGEILPLEIVTILGSQADNEIILPHAAPRQVRLIQEHQTCWVENLAAPTVTWLNGQPLQQPTPLSPGDVIAIGDTHFRFELN